jgi:hypothetical protein
MDHHRQSETPQRSRASLIVLIVLAFLLMIAAVILVLSLPEDKTPILPEATTTLDVADTGFACSDSEAQQLYPFGEGVVKLSHDRVAFLDIRGVEQFGIDVTMATPLACRQGSRFLAADRGGHSYVAISGTAVLFSGETAGRICGASLSDNGYLAILQDQSEGTGLVTLYAPDTGRKLFDCFNPESGYPLSVAFPADGKAFDMALVNTASSVICPVIKRYSLDGSQLGQRIPDLEGLMPQLCYDGKGRPVLVGATRLVSLTYDSDQIVWQTGFFQVIGARSCGQGLLVLARDRLDGPCNLCLVGDDGSIRFTLPVGDEATSLDVHGDLAIVACGTRLLAADCKKGILILDADLAAEVVRAGFAGARSVTVISRGGVRRLNIPG